MNIFITASLVAKQFTLIAKCLQKRKLLVKMECKRNGNFLNYTIRVFLSDV